MKHTRAVALTLAVTLMGGAFASPARAQWTVTSPDGKSTLTLSVLAQTQFEALKNPGTDEYQQNVFVRRARLMFGGRFNDRTAFFIDTDTPNMGKGQSTGSKVANTTLLQDLVITETVCPGFKVDAGMLLVPMSHNSQQSATSLLAVDYGPYSFLQSDATDSKVSRDYGVQGRAYLAKRHAEIRAGLFQGYRGTASTAAMRSTVRGVFYPFEADTGLFYAGPSFGKHKVLAIGGSYDTQMSYYAWAGDVALDWPLRGDAITAQGDYMRYDGKTTFAALPRQDVALVEIGYYIRLVHLGPYVQYASRNYNSPQKPDETRLQAGVAWWANGHKCNVKLGAARLTKQDASDGTQVVAQWQVLAF